MVRSFLEPALTCTLPFTCIMKTIFFLLLASGVGHLAAESAIPKKAPRETYNKLVEDWPFALATAPPKPEEKVDSIFNNMFLGSAAKISEGGVEKDWVVLRDQSDPSRIIQLFGNDLNEENGFQLLKINWTDNPKDITVDVKKGDELKKGLKSDQGAWGPGPIPVQPGARPAANGRPAAIPVPGGAGAIRPPGGIVTPQPRGPASPRPSNVPAPQAIKVNPGSRPAGTPAVRQRVIPPPR
jgi:hypothetical protein